MGRRKNFISSLNGNEWPSDKQIVAEAVWSEPYKATVYKIANRYVLLTIDKIAL